VERVNLYNMFVTGGSETLKIECPFIRFSHQLNNGGEETFHGKHFQRTSFSKLAFASLLCKEEMDYLQFVSEKITSTLNFVNTLSLILTR